MIKHIGRGIYLVNVISGLRGRKRRRTEGGRKRGEKEGAGNPGDPERDAGEDGPGGDGAVRGGKKYQGLEKAEGFPRAWLYLQGGIFFRGSACICKKEGEPGRRMGYRYLTAVQTGIKLNIWQKREGNGNHVCNSRSWKSEAGV